MKKRQTVHIDPAVAAILGEAETRVELRGMGPEKRKLARRRVRRQSVTLELNADLVPLLKEVAAAHGISTAGVVDRLLVDALGRYAAGEVTFEGFLEASRSPRYDWVVRVDVEEVREGVRERIRET